MEVLRLKSLIKQIGSLVEKCLPLNSPFNKEIIEWAAAHGWEISNSLHQKMLVRQSLLNSIIRQNFPEIDLFETPLDSLRIEAPASLARNVYGKSQSSEERTFNFWGELYSLLIPQPERRQIGQFWTDETISEWMVAWLLLSRPKHLADMGCGAGNFLLKASSLLQNTECSTKLSGYDLSPLVLNVAQAAFLTRHSGNPTLSPILNVSDYLRSELPEGVDAVICNPPYTRHHHIAVTVKDQMQMLFKSRLRVDVSRQGTLAFYFLLKLITEMREGAKAAFIVPMETLDARYGKAAKRALCEHTVLNAIIHFSPEMNAFHKVDVGASILLFEKGRKAASPVRHLTLKSLPTTEELLLCLGDEEYKDRELSFGSLSIQSQDDLLRVAKWSHIASGSSSPTEWQNDGLVVPLKMLAKVVRGIATGANEFFVLTDQRVKELSLDSFVVPTVHRNREVQEIVLDRAGWQSLSDAGKCVWLLYLNGDQPDERLSGYLAEGEARSYHLRSLVQTRRRWYAMERREIPAIFFTLLTRGNPRFILNRADVRPLNMFLLIYPNRELVQSGAVELLWALLNSRFSISQLYSISRTYGGNTLKVEPRELDNLPVINPLTLPERAKERLRALIDDFKRHRQSTLLVSKVDEVIEELLISREMISNPSQSFEQLQLLR